MLPGLTPSLMLAAGEPLHDVYVDPNPADWFGVTFDYYTDLYLQHSGGVGPYTYLWATDGLGDAVIESPNSRATRVHSNSGAVAAVTCTITDAIGNQTLVNGDILGVTG